MSHILADRVIRIDRTGIDFSAILNTAFKHFGKRVFLASVRGVNVITENCVYLILYKDGERPAYEVLWSNTISLNFNTVGTIGLLNATDTEYYLTLTPIG